MIKVSILIANLFHGIYTYNPNMNTRCVFFILILILILILLLYGAGPDKIIFKAQKILNIFREDKSLIIHIQHISVGKAQSFFLPKKLSAEIYKNVRPINTEKITTKYFPNSI